MSSHGPSLRLLRIATVPVSLHLLLRGQFGFMRTQGFDVLTASAAGPEVEAVREEGVDHVVIPFTRRITPWQDLLCLWRLIRLCRQYRPHIVHTHTPKAGLLGMLAARVAFVPVRIHTVAGIPGMEARGWRRMLLEFTERLTVYCATRVYPNSHGLRVYMEKLGISPLKLKVLGMGSSNGIDSRHFSRDSCLQQKADALRRHHGIQPGEIVFCFVGRVVRDKGIVELVDAFQQLKKSMPAWLFIVGHTEEELDPLPEQTWADIKGDSHIVIPGFQPDVRPLMVAADIFILPSYREGFPNVVLQACALEVPCIVTDITGSNEIITHEKNGLVVRPKDTDALRRAMESLASEPALRTEFAALARKRVIDNFDQRAMWNLLLAEYRALIETCVPHDHQADS